MIASLADHLKRREERQNYKEVVEFLGENNRQISAWTLIISIKNSIKQTTFSYSDAKKMVHILCTEFGIKESEIQYFNTFSSSPFLSRNTRPSNTIDFTSKKFGHRENNERLMNNLQSAIYDKIIEYRQGLDLVIQIIENYPDARKCLQG